MTKDIGWAEPAEIIGQPRTHKVAGFTYLYAEQRLVHETEVGHALDGLFPTALAAFETLFAGAPKPPRLVMFMNVPDQERMYHVQTGFCVPPGTPAAAGALVRDVPPALVASLVACCSINAIWKSYGPLMEYMNQSGLQPLDEGWREYTLYDEGPGSPNTITWVQHLAAE